MSEEFSPAPIRADEAARPAANPAVALEGVRRTFDDVVALDDISLPVAFGTIVGVIGPSGAGKTTAIRLMTGGLRPDAGRVTLLGEDPTRLSARTRERIGLMPQHVAHYEDLTASQNLDFVGTLFGLLVRRRRRRIAEMLGLLGLEDVRDRRAGQLSGGEQRRLQLAAALLHEPDLAFLDEPTAGIDPLVRQAIWQELQRLRDAGHTLVVTTQYVGEAEECDQVALIADGRLVALASPEELRRVAMGGEVVEVESVGLIDAAALAADDIVTAVRQVGPRTVHVVTDDASRATPAIIERVERSSGPVASVREHRPTFDDVFAVLVERADGAGDDDASAVESTDTVADPARAA